MREKQEEEEKNSAQITRDKALEKYNKANAKEEESDDEEILSKKRYQQDDRELRIEPAGEGSRRRKSAAEATGNLMRGPKSDSFAFHISQADGSDVASGKHHTGTAKYKRARKQNPKTNVNEDLEEKTWQPVAASILQVAESKPVKDSKFVQNSTKNAIVKKNATVAQN
jgi:hypothetical protein